MVSRRNICRLIFFILYISGYRIYGIDTLTLKDIQSENVSNYLYIYEDKARSFTVESFLEGKFLESFANSKKKDPVFGFSKSAYWAYLQIENDSDQEKDLILSSEYAFTDELNFYDITLSNDGKKILNRSVKTGDTRSLSQRDLSERYFVFKINFLKGEKKILLLEQRTEGPIQFTIRLYEKSAYYLKSRKDYIFLGIYYGAMLMMLAYNLFLAYSLRDRNYLLYCILILLVILTNLEFNGLGVLLFWDKNPWFGNLAANFFAGISFLISSVFTYSFLGLTRQRKLSWLYYIGIFVAVIHIFNVLILPLRIVAPMTAIFGPVFGLMCIIGPWIRLREGYRPAFFYLVSFLVLNLLIILSIMTRVGIVSSKFLEEYFLQAGTIIEVLFFSFALTDRIKLFQEEKENINFIYNQLLEGKILERTRQLESEKNRAIEASNAKSSFISMMSHEIRTPLNGVTGAVELLSFTDLTDEQKDLLGLMQSSSDALLSVINDILDISKIESGKLEIEYSRINFKKLMKEVVHLIHNDAQKKKLKVELNIDPKVEDHIVIDPARLRQVLLNLLSNSVKFTFIGEISVRVFKTGDILCISVKDTGIGIPSEKMKHLFQPFFQVDSTITRRFGGTGLGLSISKRLCELMGCEIEVFSKENEGSEFIVKIPKISKNIAILSDTKDHFDSELQEFSKIHPLEILIAEDNLLNQKIALRILSNMGYQIDVCNNGLEAVSKSTKKRYDLVLMDIEMPLMDGIDAAKMIADKLGEDRPLIVAMTAHEQDDFKVSIGSSEIDDYLSKPIKPDEFVKIVRKWFRPKEKS